MDIWLVIAFSKRFVQPSSIISNNRMRLDAGVVRNLLFPCREPAGVQAMQVAERIGQTMAALRIEDREQRTIPVPTVSQGIAIYPMEADEIYRLIDLADRRLYIAKERGRNQIEPDISHWENLQNIKRAG